MSRIAIVTGANKGIGLETTRALVKSGLFKRVYLTSRNVELGLASLKELEADIGSSILKHHQLDISCSYSIGTFKTYIESNYGGFDVLVNNAGIVLGLGPPTDGISSDRVDHTNAMMATNFWGTLNMMKAFYPLVNQNGRIVNLSSMQAQRAMSIFPLTTASKGPELHSINRTLSLERLEELATEYEKASNENKLIENGWLDDWITNYATTKLFINALTRIYGNKAEKDQNGVLVNCCCPGYVQTDLSNNAKDATKVPLEGCKTTLWLALLKNGSDGPQGCYLADA